MRHIYNLTLFDEQNNQQQNTNQQQAQNQNTAAGGGTYSYAQAEEIANARAERAATAALASFFKQQGMSEDQVTEAIKDYKDKKAANTPDVDAITRERDDYKAKFEAAEQAGKLTAKGVKTDDADYVLFKVRALMAADDKLDFDKAVDKFLKDNPRYTKAGSSYRVKTAAGNEGNSGGTDDKKSKNAAVNAAIRGAFGR